jgi:hypothetical protein
LTGAPIFLSGSGTPPPPPPPGGCDNVTITAASGSINLGGLTAPVITVQVFNSSWATVYNQTLTNSPGTHAIPSLAAGTYHVKVSFYNANWTPICDKSQDAIVQATNPGGNCNNITITPASGSINLGGLTAPVITVQVFNNSWVTVYNQAFTNSPGTLAIPSLAAGTYHVKVSFYNPNWTLICDKSQDAIVQSSTPPPVSCNNITISPTSGSILLGGITAPVASIQVFNGSWATVYNQTVTNAPGTVNIPSLPAGTYHVKVNFYSASWSPICEKFEDAIVGSGAAARTSEVAAEKSSTDLSATRISVAPNPFANTIQVTIGSNRNESATLIIVDAAGRQLYKKPVGLQIGINRFTLDGSRYIQGNYFLKLISVDRNETVKLIKQ